MPGRLRRAGRAQQPGTRVGPVADGPAQPTNQYAVPALAALVNHARPAGELSQAEHLAQARARRVSADVGLGGSDRCAASPRSRRGEWYRSADRFGSDRDWARAAADSRSSVGGRSRGRVGGCSADPTCAARRAGPARSPERMPWSRAGSDSEQTECRRIPTTEMSLGTFTPWSVRAPIRPVATRSLKASTPVAAESSTGVAVAQPSSKVAPHGKNLDPERPRDHQDSRCTAATRRAFDALPGGPAR